MKDYIERNVTNFDFKIYLQGSYANSTNIWGNSDVDIVIELDGLFNHNINECSSEDQKKFHEKYPCATINIEDFKSTIISVLKDSNYIFEDHNKCLKIISGTPLKADLVICNEYHNYYNYPNYYKGIKVLTKNRNKIISYPKKHIKNGESKNDSTNGNFKKTVRIFKNIKSYLVSASEISESIVSSYFIECLLYNVPDKYFLDNNVENRFDQVYTLLLNLLKNYKDMKTQDEMNLLFGDSNKQWKVGDAWDFIVAILKYTEDWKDYHA